MDLAPFIALLAAPPGPPAPEDPWLHALSIACAYLVDDQKRAATLRTLVEAVGDTPGALLAASDEELALALEGGGILPEVRADKVRRAAAAMRVAGLESGAELLELARRSERDAVKVLATMPGVSKGVATRILVRAGVASGLPLESNGLRVLLRLGFGEEGKSWTESLRSATAAVSDMPRDPGQSQAWLERLRAHGKSTCKVKPRCRACPLRPRCPGAFPRS